MDSSFPDHNCPSAYSSRDHSLCFRHADHLSYWVFKELGEGRLAAVLSCELTLFQHLAVTLECPGLMSKVQFSLQVVHLDGDLAGFLVVDAQRALMDIQLALASPLTPPPDLATPQPRHWPPLGLRLSILKLSRPALRNDIQRKCMSCLWWLTPPIEISQAEGIASPEIQSSERVTFTSSRLSRCKVAMSPLCQWRIFSSRPPVILFFHCCVTFNPSGSPGH